MAEASKFMSYFGSKRKAPSENETNTEKKSKSSEYEFSIIKLRKYQKEFLFWNTTNEKPCDNPSKRVTWIEFGSIENTGYQLGDPIELPIWVLQKVSFIEAVDKPDKSD